MVNNSEITVRLPFPVDTNPLIDGGDIEQHFKTGLVVVLQVTQYLYQPVAADPEGGHAFGCMLTDKLALAEFTIQGIDNRRQCVLIDLFSNCAQVD